MKTILGAGWLLALASGAAWADRLPPRAIQSPAETQQWAPGPPSLPAGTQMILLEGDPKSEGLFTMRLKVPAGTRLAPHWHPRDERVTVLAGAVTVGFGDRWDGAAMRRFGPGSYYVNPAQAHHYVGFPEASIIQITAQGPWGLHYLEQL